MEGIRDEVEVFYRDPLAVIQDIFSGPKYCEQMVFAPAKHWTNKNRKKRVYNEMHTGNWWWRKQVRPTRYISQLKETINGLCSKERLPKGRTIVPYIINTDKTQLTTFSGGKEVYPAYITIGNVPKAVRRKPSQHAYRLFAYLPIVSFNNSNLSKRDKRLAKSRVYHHAMKIIFQSLKKPAAEGVELYTADGRVRHCHPLLAGASLDYPEQCLASGVRYGKCPICQCTPDTLGEYADNPRRTQAQTLQVLKLAKLRRTQAALDDFLKAYGIAPIFKPFWEGQPHADIHSAITPDILHQIYQGLVKHLTKWIQRLIGPKELDQRLARLPPNHPLRIYNNGVSGFSNMSGNEHRQITKQLLGCIIGIVEPKTVRATRALLDFVFLAQYQSHSDDTLGYLEEALKLFHADKDIFITLGARSKSASQSIPT